MSPIRGRQVSAFYILFYASKVLIMPCVISLCSLSWVGHWASRPYYLVAEEKPVVIWFFYLVNKTGQNIRLKAVADGKELFTQEIGSKIESEPGIKDIPPPSKSPAVELKMSIDPGTETLEVQELNSGIKETLSIKDFTSHPGGFRITVKSDKILLEQDYYPVRGG